MRSGVGLGTSWKGDVKVKRLLAVLTLVATLVGVASTSLAATPTATSGKSKNPMAADPNVVFPALDKVHLDNKKHTHERITFTDGSYIDATLNTKSVPAGSHKVVQPDNSVSTLATTRTTLWASVGGYDVWGAQLWAMDQTAWWTWDGAQVVAWQDPAVLDTFIYAPGWAASNPHTSVYNGWLPYGIMWEGRATFQLNFPVPGAQTDNAWIQMDGHHDGSAYAQWGGGQRGGYTTY